MAVEQDLKDRVVLITGASRGIGYAAAKNAAARGAHVIAVARTVGGLEELDDEIQAAGGSATLVPADLSDGDAIDRLGAAVYSRWGKLDGLIANAAALGVISPLAHIAPDEFEKVINLNVTSVFRLVRSFDVLLRESDAGRFVGVSSGAADGAKPYWSLYAASKVALNALVQGYAGELAATNVKANVFYPGRVRTAMRAQAVPGEDPNTLPTPDDVAPALIDMVSPNFEHTGKIIDVLGDSPRAI